MKWHINSSMLLVHANVQLFYVIIVSFSFFFSFGCIVFRLIGPYEFVILMIVYVYLFYNPPCVHEISSVLLYFIFLICLFMYMFFLDSIYLFICFF